MLLIARSLRQINLSNNDLFERFLHQISLGNSDVFTLEKVTFTYSRIFNQTSFRKVFLIPQQEYLNLHFVIYE